MQTTKIIIIGGGASALALGYFLKKDFMILEANHTCGAKIAVSGGGRCNFTNESVSADNYTGDKDFISKVLDSFGVEDFLGLADSLGATYEVRKNRQYFCKKSAKELLDPLVSHLKHHIRTNAKVLEVSKGKDGFVVKTDKGEYAAKKVVVASGGISYPVLGASDVGYRIAQAFGHKIVTPRPALVGFTVQPPEFWFKALSGVSVQTVVSVAGKSFRENILFAHKGVSGPAILNASLYWEKGSIGIDFLPDFSFEKIQKNSQKQITTLLPLPKNFIKAFLDSVGLVDKRFCDVDEGDMQKLSKLKNYEFAPAGTFGLSKAEITKGGVATADIDPDTMESRFVGGLYFVGEVLDVNGELGGYNFHFAFASAAVCAKGLSAS